MNVNDPYVQFKEAGWFFPILTCDFFYDVSFWSLPGHTQNNNLNGDENEAKAFLDTYNKDYAPLLNKFTVATWNWETNLTDHNADIVVSWITEYATKITTQNSHAINQEWFE